MEIAIAILVALYLIGFIVAFLSSIPACFFLSDFWEHIFIGSCCVAVYSMGAVVIMMIIRVLFGCWI